MSKTLHFLNGKLVTEEELCISPRDLGFLRGYGVFDFLKTYHRRPFRLREHIDRLFNSAELIGLKLPWSKEQIEQWVLETLAANPEGEKFIKIIVSGGVSHSMLPTGEPTLVILIDPAVQYPKENYENGIGVITVQHTRYTPHAKSNNYIEGVKQCQEAAKIGAVEPVYYSNEQVYEGSNSNIFAVIRGKLVTPHGDILAGITRQVLLDILKDPAVEVKNFTHAELLNAEEVFFTGSGKEVTPITAINGKPVGNGKVGPITKEVIRQFREYTENW